MAHGTGAPRVGAQGHRSRQDASRLRCEGSRGPHRACADPDGRWGAPLGVGDASRIHPIRSFGDVLSRSSARLDRRGAACGKRLALGVPYRGRREDVGSLLDPVGGGPGLPRRGARPAGGSGARIRRSPARMDPPAGEPRSAPGHLGRRRDVEGGPDARQRGHRPGHDIHVPNQRVGGSRARHRAGLDDRSPHPDAISHPRRWDELAARRPPCSPPLVPRCPARPRRGTGPSQILWLA